MSNIDKHRLLHASLIALTDQPPVFDGAAPVAGVRWRTSVVKDGAEVARLRFLEDGGNDEVSVKARIPVDVRFGEMQIPLSKLHEIRNATVSTLNFFIKGFRVVDDP